MLLLATALSAKDEKSFAMPPASPARSYPAHDEQPQEKVSVAADPYDTPERAALFRVDYANADMLPIFFVITNDGDAPLNLRDLRVQVVTGRRAKLDPAAAEDIYRRISRQTRRGDEGNSRPFPMPRSNKMKPLVGQEARDEIDRAQFHARAVEPHSTQSGFFFFDVREVRGPLEHSSFYASGVRNGKGQELFYFEISLDKAGPPPVAP